MVLCLRTSIILGSWRSPIDEGFSIPTRCWILRYPATQRPASKVREASLFGLPRILSTSVHHGEPWEIPKIATVSNNKPPIWGEGCLIPFWYNWRWCIELGEVRTFIQLNLVYWAGATLCPALCWKTQQCTVGPWHDEGALLLTTPESVTPLGMCITTTHLPDKTRMFATHSQSYFHVFHIIKTGHGAQSSSFKPVMGLQPKIWDTQKWASLLNNWNWWISSRSPSGLDFDPHPYHDSLAGGYMSLLRGEVLLAMTFTSLCASISPHSYVIMYQYTRILLNM